jgi:hypothetical protein
MAAQALWHLTDGRNKANRATVDKADAKSLLLELLSNGSNKIVENNATKVLNDLVRPVAEQLKQQGLCICLVDGCPIGFVSTIRKVPQCHAPEAG